MTANWLNMPRPWMDDFNRLMRDVDAAWNATNFEASLNPDEFIEQMAATIAAASRVCEHMKLASITSSLMSAHAQHLTEGATMTTSCASTLNIKGEHFPCDGEPAHPGLAHSNRDAEAIWSNDVPLHRCNEADGCTDDDCGLLVEDEG